MTVDDRSFICLYFGDPCECQNCGGCTSAEDGPFPGDSRYCSEDCYADAQERNRREAMREAMRMACCPSCGFDNQEHAPDCEATS